MPKRPIIIAFILLSLADAFAGQINVGNYKGLDTDNDPLYVANGMSPDSRNVLTDTNKGLGPRMGFIQFSTESAANDGPWLFPHSNGTLYFITQSNGVLKVTAGGTNFNIALSTVNTLVRTAAAALGDKFYWASSDGLKHWDTLTVTVDSRTLDFNQLVAHKGRLAGSGVSGDKRTIYLSEYLNGSNFALAVDPVDTDPTRIQVQGSFDEVISGLFSSYRDMLIWFKANTFGGILGSRRSNFQSIVLSNSVGSAYPETVKDCDGELRFLGSRKAIWGYNGASLVKLTKGPGGTEGIDSVMDTLIQGEAVSRSITQTTRNDFALGTSSGGSLDIDTTPGEIFWTSQEHVIFGSDDFEDGNFTSNPEWVGNTGGWTVVAGSITPNGGGTKLLGTRSTYSTGTWTFKGDLYDDLNSMSLFFMSDSTDSACPSYYVGNGLALYQRSSICVDTIIRGSSVTDSGLRELIITRTAEGIIFSSFTDNTVTNAGMLPVQDTSMAYSNFIVLNHAGGGPAGNWSVGDISLSTLNYTHSSTFTSVNISMGQTASRWGSFTATDLRNGASIQYGIYSDTNSDINIRNATTFIASQTITSGQIPTIQISSYVTVTAQFIRAQTTQTATMYDFTVSWTDGNPLRAASLWTNQRYWIGCSVSSPTANNTVLVFDRNKQWQYWTGINMVGAVMYNGLPYFSNATGIYQAESGYSDNGSAIPSYFYTQGYYPSGPNYKSILDSVYLITDENQETLETSYFIDGTATEHAMPDLIMNTFSGYQDVKLPFSDTSLEQGNIIQFKFAVNGTTNWRLLNASLNFDSEKIMHD